MNVYIIRSETNHYKIGKANIIKKRLQGLQTATHLDLEIVASISVDNAFSLERLIQSELKRFHVRGEWFKLTDDQLNDLILKYGFQKFKKPVYSINSMVKLMELEDELQEQKAQVELLESVIELNYETYKGTSIALDSALEGKLGFEVRYKLDAMTLAKKAYFSDGLNASVFGVTSFCLIHESQSFSLSLYSAVAMVTCLAFSCYCIASFMLNVKKYDRLNEELKDLYVMKLNSGKERFLELAKGDKEDFFKI